MSLPIPPGRGSIPDTPEALYDRLRGTDPRVQNIWSHQADVLRVYYEDHVQEADVALELPTGAGKTLVGLLIAEWRRLKLKQRVVYVCPNNLLARQVAERAAGYGIDVVNLTGSHRLWPSAHESAYRTGATVAIANYHSLFSSPSYIDDAHTLILDDAHAGEGPVSGHWTLVASRHEHPDLFFAIWDVVADLFPREFARSVEKDDLDPFDRRRVEMAIPFGLVSRETEILDVLDTYAVDGDPMFAAKALRPAVARCLVFASWAEIAIRPFIPPTASHAAFAQPTQRIYMSATLGLGGELERAFGIEKIERVPVPKGWQPSSAGRRLILMPGASMAPGDADRVIGEIVKGQPRTLAIAPSKPAAEELKSLAGDGTLFFDASSADAFRRSSPGMLVLANQYDGLDLPNEDCGLIILSGLPAQGHSQERFLWSTLGATRVLSERVRTRIVQGAGRATRNRNDSAVVVLRGEELLRFVQRVEEREALRPELQSEMQLAMHYTTVSSVDYATIARTFYDRGDDWEETEDYLRQEAEQLIQKPPPGSDLLLTSAPKEVHACWQLWRGDIVEARTSAIAAVTQLAGDELRPYRTFWLYLAALVADLVYQGTNAVADRDLAIRLREDTVDASRTSAWRPRFSDLAPQPVDRPVDERAMRASKYFIDWVKPASAGAEGRLAELSSLLAGDAGQFERGLERLGLLLGFDSKRPTGEDAGPDGVWITDGEAQVIFEAKTEERSDVPLSARDARQASSHGRWVERQLKVPCANGAITSLVCWKDEIHPAARTVADGSVGLVDPGVIEDIARRTVSALRRVRATSRGLTPEAVAQRVANEFWRANLDTPSILGQLKGRSIASVSE
jgi:hypothetical protein